MVIERIVLANILGMMQVGARRGLENADPVYKNAIIRLTTGNRDEGSSIDLFHKKQITVLEGI